MTKILIDRSTVEQALEALEMESNPTAVVEVAEGRWELKSDLAITALRAALVEDSMQKFTDVNQELEAALAEPVQEQVKSDHETRAEIAEQQVVQLAEERDHYRNLWLKAKQAEPVEPVAWECKAGGLRRLTQRQYEAQPDNIKRHYTRIEPVQEPVGAVLVNRESREGVMFYSVDMIPDPSTLKDRFELVPVYTAPPQHKENT